MTSKPSVLLFMATLPAALGYAAAPVAFGATWTVSTYGDDAGDTTTLRHVIRNHRRCSR